MELKEIKRQIDNNPKKVKEQLESGSIMLSNDARKYLNKKYLNQVHIDYTIDYSLNTGIFSLSSQLLNYEDSHNISISNKANKELSIIAYILNTIKEKNQEIINSIAITCKTKRVYNILTKKQRSFDVYSKEFRLFYKISKFITTNNIKLKLKYVK